MLAMFAGVALAQNPADLFNKPPEKVDKALRARIDEFYQDHVKQQFRKADTLVAADTKEFFYIQNKPAYLSCEVGHVEYSEKFTRAKATVLCEQYLRGPRIHRETGEGADSQHVESGTREVVLVRGPGQAAPDPVRRHEGRARPG